VPKIKGVIIDIISRMEAFKRGADDVRKTQGLDFFNPRQVLPLPISGRAGEAFPASRGWYF
jgi:hypothetical protein